jgi:hypothetical protein
MGGKKNDRGDGGHPGHSSAPGGLVQRHGRDPTGHRHRRAERGSSRQQRRFKTGDAQRDGRSSRQLGGSKRRLCWRGGLGVAVSAATAPDDDRRRGSLQGRRQGDEHAPRRLARLPEGHRHGRHEAPALRLRSRRRHDAPDVRSAGTLGPLRLVRFRDLRAPHVDRQRRGHEEGARLAHRGERRNGQSALSTSRYEQGVCVGPLTGLDHGVRLHAGSPRHDHRSHLRRLLRRHGAVSSQERHHVPLRTEPERRRRVPSVRTDFKNSTIPTFYTEVQGSTHLTSGRLGWAATIAWMLWHLAGQEDFWKKEFLESTGKFQTGIFKSQVKNWP